MDKQIKVLVVGEDTFTREGLVKILNDQPGVTVVGIATTEEAVAKALNVQPDVVILDVSIPGIKDLKIVPEIKERVPQAKVLLLTISESEYDLFSALKFKAQGYLLKTSSTDMITNGVRRVAAGETVLSPQMVAAIAAKFHPQVVEPTLSRRESQILEFLREGSTNTEIARRLSIQESTVKTHVHNILVKLRAKNRTEASLFTLPHSL